ncbi:MAG: ATP-binding protein [Lachnospiraceae bacterium]|nr:ATP-binding protein [Lachnospiraceae bacterium]
MDRKQPYFGIFDYISQACHVWDENLEIVYCNAASLRIFRVASREEYVAHFYEFSPAFQANGQASDTLARQYIQKALDEGSHVFEWLHKSVDGELFPCEVSLLRAEVFGKRYVFASIKEIREYLEMLSSIEFHNDLLMLANRVASTLFSKMNMQNMDSVIVECLELIGKTLHMDRVQNWRNMRRDGRLYMVLEDAWTSDYAREKGEIEAGFSLPYDSIPGWEEMFELGGYLHGPVVRMRPVEQKIFISFGIKSVLIIPVFMEGKFWGFFSIDDCRQEREFSQEELHIISSAGSMLASAKYRMEQTGLIYQRDNLLFTVNQVSEKLLSQSARNADDCLYQCLGMMGKAVDAGCANLWKNSWSDDCLYSTLHCAWSGDSKGESFDTQTVLSFKEDIPHIFEFLQRNEPLNILTKDLPEQERTFFSMLGIVSSLAIPIFVNNEFWGILVFDRFENEKIFDENEVSILCSTALLIANALLHNEYLMNIQETSKRLEEALETARNASNAKSDFLAKMSHDMRTPLNAVIGLSELILSEDNIEEETREKLTKVCNSGNLLLRLVNDILDISKVEAGKLEIVPGEYEFASVLNDVMSQNMLKKADKPIAFVLEINPNLPSHMYGDDRRIKQIMSNLLSNAFKYTKSGQVTLSLQGERMSARDNYIWLYISVKDTGVGIKPKELEDLFGDYTRLDLRKHREQEGTGLGLSITKRLAELMGGEIHVESEYGVGSTFSVAILQEYRSDQVLGAKVVENLKNFTYTDSKRSQQAQMRCPAMPYANVLVVDDNVTNLYVFQGMVKSYKMRVDCVSSGQQAVDAIRQERIKYDIIFMDHMMPEMDGIEATKIIREKIGTDYAKNIPIVAFTANAISGSKDMFLRNGFQAFLSKPIEMMALDDILRHWVRDKKREQEIKVAADNPLDTPGLANVQIPGLDVKGGLERFGGDEEGYGKILNTYASTTEPLLESIAQVRMENLSDYVIMVHGIKSSSFGIGANMLGEMAKVLEFAGKEGDLKMVLKYNENFIKEARYLMGNIRKCLDEMASSAKKEQKSFPDQAVLAKLYYACQAYDMDGVDQAIAEIEQYRYEQGNDLIEWLQENIILMNFAEVEEKLSEYVIGTF